MMMVLGKAECIRMVSVCRSLCVCAWGGENGLAWLVAWMVRMDGPMTQIGEGKGRIGLVGVDLLVPPGLSPPSLPLSFLFLHFFEEK